MDSYVRGSVWARLYAGVKIVSLMDSATVVHHFRIEVLQPLGG
jgi:hypothetical protein